MQEEALPTNLAGNKRRSLSSQGGLLNRMFGGSSGSAASKTESTSGTDLASNRSEKQGSKSPSPEKESPDPGGAEHSIQQTSLRGETASLVACQVGW